MRNVMKARRADHLTIVVLAVIIALTALRVATETSAAIGDGLNVDDEGGQLVSAAL
jgi:hypothetical protein